MTEVRSGHFSFEVEAVLFDKDGTLLDMDATWVPAGWAWVHAAVGGDIDLASALAGELGLTKDKVVPDGLLAVSTIDVLARLTQRLLVEHGVTDVGARIQRAVRESTATALKNLTPLGDIAATFERLTKAGLKIGVVTSDDRLSTETTMRALNVSRHIATIVAGDDGPAAKPSPEPLLAAAQSLGLDPSVVLYVGDSEVDRQAAASAHMRFIAVEPQPTRPDAASIVSIDELILR